MGNNNQHTRMALMTDKVAKLNLLNFAESYGLNAVPELRHFKTKHRMIANESDSDDDFLTAKTESKVLESVPEIKISSRKTISKDMQAKKTADTSKKIIKKFESESEDEVNVLNIEREKENLKNSNKIDKTSFKQRQKEKKIAIKRKKKLATQERSALLALESDEDVQVELR